MLEALTQRRYLLPFKAARLPQQFGDGLRAAALDLLTGDDLDDRGGLGVGALDVGAGDLDLLDPLRLLGERVDGCRR